MTGAAPLAPPRERGAAYLQLPPAAAVPAAALPPLPPAAPAAAKPSRGALAAAAALAVLAAGCLAAAAVTPGPLSAALAGPARAFAGARRSAEEPSAERLLLRGEDAPFRKVVFGRGSPGAGQEDLPASRRTEGPDGDVPGAAAAAAAALVGEEASGLELPLPVAGVYVINLPVHRERFLSFLDHFCPKTGVSRDSVRIVDGVNATEALQHSWPEELLPGIERNPTQGKKGQLGLALAHLSAWRAVRDSPECQAGAEQPFSWEGPLRGDILGWGYRTDPADTLLACRKLCEDDGDCEAIQFSESAADGPEKTCVMHNNRSAWRAGKVHNDFFMHFLTRDQKTENRYALVFEDDETVHSSFNDAVMAIVQATVKAPVKPDFINLNCLRPNGDAVLALLPDDARLQAVNKERDHENQCWNIDDITCPNVWMGAYMVRCGGASALLETMHDLEYDGQPYTGSLTFDRAVSDMQLRQSNGLTTWVISPPNSVTVHSEEKSDRMDINKGALRRLLG